MFGFFARSVSAIVASVSGHQKDGDMTEETSLDDSRSITSNDSKSRRFSAASGKSMTTNRQQFQVEPVKESLLDEIVQFLLENLAESESIVASAKRDDEKLFQTELVKLLSDLIRDSSQCTSSGIIRDPKTRQIDGITLACKTTIFEQQLDRLHSYQVSSSGVQDIIDFMKYAFNKVDLPYFSNERSAAKPVFIAVICVRKDKYRQGIGKALIAHSKKSAQLAGCDSLMGLCTHIPWYEYLLNNGFIKVEEARYDSFKGEHKYPPITGKGPNAGHSVNAILQKFV